MNTPTFSGSTEPFAVVDLYANGSNVPFGATEADINGYWSFTVGQPGQVTYPGASSSILESGRRPLEASPRLVSILVGSLLGVVRGVASGSGSRPSWPTARTT